MDSGSIARGDELDEPRAARVSQQDALGRPRLAADVTERYGPEPAQVGDLRLPEGRGPHPVAVLLHGGCWRAIADRTYMEALAVELTAAGWATWNLDYRTVDHPGGGYPGTFRDVADGIDHLRALAASHPLDPGRVVTLGHSAGGHLALWAAARPALVRGRRAVSIRRRPDAGARRDADGLTGDDPLRVSAVVALAAVADLEHFDALDARGCGDAVPSLLGGSPADVPERVARTSPARLLPLEVPQLLVTGELDDTVPAEHSRAYVDRARAADDDAELVVPPGAGHFEVVAPWWTGWPVVREPLLAFLGGV